VSLAASDNYASVWAQMEGGTSVSAPTTAGDFMAAVYANIVMGATFTTGANSTVNGVRVQSEISSTTISHAGRLSAFECLTKSGSYQAWDYGLYVAGATTGINVGASTTGISLSGVQSNAIVITTTGSTATDGHCLAIGSIGTPITTATSATSAVKVFSDCTNTTGYHVGGWFTSQLTASGYTSIYALRGHADIKTAITSTTGAAYYVGVHGRARVTGVIDNAAATVTGVLAQLLATGTWTEVGNACALWVDNQLATNPTTGVVSMIWISQNNNSGSAVVDNVFKVYGPSIPNLFALDTCSCVTASGVTAHGGTIGKIKITIDSTDYYLLASTAPS